MLECHSFCKSIDAGDDEDVEQRYNYLIEAFMEHPEYGHPLHYAAKGGYVRTVEVMITQLKCDINLRWCQYNRYGGYIGGPITALENAIYGKRYEVSKKLIEMGADLSLIKFDNDDIKKIIENDDARLLELLIYHGIIDSAKLREYVNDGKSDYILFINNDMLTLLIAIGLRVNRRHFLSNTLLMKCADFFNSKTFDRIKLLLAAGADPSLSNDMGETVYSILSRKLTGTVYDNSIPPKTGFDKLLANGVTEDYKNEFENIIANIRRRTSKQSVTLYDLLCRQLGI